MVDSGVTPETMEETIALGHSVFALANESLGITPSGAGNHLDAKSAEKASHLAHTNIKLFLQATTMSDSDPVVRFVAHSEAMWCSHGQHPYVDMEKYSDALAYWTHENFVKLVDEYDIATVHAKYTDLVGLDCALAFVPSLAGLLRYGDISLFGRWLQKLTTSFGDIDWKVMPSMYICHPGLPACFNSLVSSVGLRNEALALQKLLGYSFDDAPATTELVGGALTSGGAAWEAQSERGYFSMWKGPQSREAARAAHWLHAPEELGHEKAAAWLDEFIAASGADDFCVDTFVCYNAGVLLPDVVRAAESMQRFDDAITIATRLLTWYPFLHTYVVECNRALGRCYAKLGRAEEAETAFQTAIAECTRIGHTFHSVLVVCDFIKHVLDPASRREEQLVALRNAMDIMPVDPVSFDIVFSEIGLDSAGLQLN